MEAIILAGGFGTRLRQMVPDLPKPMAPVAGCPFLEILLTSLASKGFSRVVLSLGYRADIVVGHFGETFAAMDLTYEIEDTPLGTGGAVRRALGKCSEDHVFVFNGDTFLDLEVAEVEAHWLMHKVPIIVGREVPDTARYGRLEIEHGRINGFCEKGISGPGIINAGCYVFAPNILDSFTPGNRFSLEMDFLSSAVKTQRFDLYLSRGYFIDIGEPEGFTRAQVELAGRCP